MPSVLEVLRSRGALNNTKTKLSLRNNELSGEIPRELGSLTNLTKLYLSNNKLSGEIPRELGSLTNLTILSLSNNKLSGEIPRELGSLTNLTKLSLSGNKLSGEIPRELGSLTNLTKLSLYNNKLSGEIPRELGSLTNLTKLFLSGNELSGEIPRELGSLINLTELYLNNNELSGEIPRELGSLINLTELSLDNNELSGEIPRELGSLTNLTELDLSENKLSGEIPRELGSLTNLTGLYLDNNKLSGEIPRELGSLTNLTILSLSGNKLSGEIPRELGSLINLTELYLDNNKLSGEIPRELGSLINLTELSLSENKLSGEIPRSIIMLKATRVNIGNNYFSKTNQIPGHWSSENSCQEMPQEAEKQSGEQKTNELCSKDCTLALQQFQSWLESQVADKEITRSLWKGIQAKERRAEAIIAGEVPFGFSDSLVWSEVVNTLQKVKEKMISSLQSEQELKTRILELRAELAKCEEEYSLVQELPAIWEEMNEPCEQAIILAQNYKEIEENLSGALEQELCDTKELSADDLSLVFNAVGLSEEIIKKTAGLTGEEFLDYSFAVTLFGEISSIELLDIRYCRHMVGIGKIPYAKHDDDDCVICFCDDTEKLIELVDEHEWNLDIEIMKKNELNGPRFLMISANDLEKMFSIPKQNAKEIWKAKKLIHSESLKRRTTETSISQSPN